MLNEQGELHWAKDDKYKGIILRKLDVGKPIWLLLDVYGACRALEFVRCSVDAHERLLLNLSKLLPSLKKEKEDPFAKLDKSICNSGTLENPKPQLKFHPDVHGKYAEFHEDHRVARRSQNHDKGVTFTNRPIVVGECIALRIVESQSVLFTNFFYIGASTTDPAEFKSKKLTYNFIFLKLYSYQLLQMGPLSEVIGRC